jgi:hypothetical protein
LFNLFAVPEEYLKRKESQQTNLVVDDLVRITQKQY